MFVGSKHRSRTGFVQTPPLTSKDFENPNLAPKLSKAKAPEGPLSGQNNSSSVKPAAATASSASAPAPKMIPGSAPIVPAGKFTPATSNAVPATPASNPAPASTDTYSGGRNKAAFDAAFNKAREMGGSTARFKFDGKDYQAAKTKDEYVSSSKQKEVDIGDLSKNTASAPPASTSTPADSTNTNASVTANRDSESNKKKQQDAGTTPQNVAESFVSVGANKYRIV